MATSSPDHLDALLQVTHAGTAALEDLLQELGRETVEEDADLVGSKPAAMDGDVQPDMALQPFEHYDYVVVLARNTHDWLALQDELGIDHVQYRLKDGRHRFGVGRVVEARALLERLRARA